MFTMNITLTITGDNCEVFKVYFKVFKIDSLHIGCQFKRVQSANEFDINRSSHTKWLQ